MEVGSTRTREGGMDPGSPGGVESVGTPQLLTIETEEWNPPVGEIQPSESCFLGTQDRPTAGSRPGGTRIIKGDGGRPGTAQSNMSMYSEPGALSAPFKVLDSHNLRIRSLAWSNEWVVTTADDSSAKVWSTKRKEEGQSWGLCATLVHDSPVWSCDFTTDGRILITGTKMSCITAWKVLPEGDFKAVDESFKKASERKTKLEVSMEEIKKKLKVTATNLETARVFAAERLRAEQTKLRQQLSYMKKMYDGDVSPKFMELKMKLAELEEACRDPWTVRWKQNMAGHFSPIESIAVSANGSWLGTASSDGSAALWDLKKASHAFIGPAGEPPPAQPLIPNQKLLGHEDAVRCISFGPRSDTVCTASQDTTIRVWRLTFAEPSKSQRTSRYSSEQFKSTPKWVEMLILGEQGGEVTCCCFSPLVGKLLATVARDGVACVYYTDMVDEEEVGENTAIKSQSIKGSVSRTSSAEFDVAEARSSIVGRSGSGASEQGQGERGAQLSKTWSTADGRERSAADGGGGGGSSRRGSLKGGDSYPGSRGEMKKKVTIAGSDTDLEGSEPGGVDDMDKQRVLILAMQRYEIEEMSQPEFVPWDELNQEKKDALIHREVDSYLNSDEYRSWLEWNQLVQKMDSNHLSMSMSPSHRVSTASSSSHSWTPQGGRRLASSHGKSRDFAQGPSAGLSLPPLRRSRRRSTPAISHPNLSKVGRASAQEDVQSLLLETVHDVGPTPGGAKRLTSVDNWRVSSTMTSSSMSNRDSSEPWTVCRKFQAHDRGLCNCIFGKDGKTLLTSSSDSDVRVWDTRDWSLRYAITPPVPESSFDAGLMSSAQPRGVFCMSLSKDGGWLITSSWEGTSQIWDLSETGYSNKRDDRGQFHHNPKFSSPGYSQPVLPPRTKKVSSSTTIEGGRRRRKESISRLSFKQVTDTYHEHGMPFSMQCHSFQVPQVRLAGGRPVTADSIHQGIGYSEMFAKQVTSEEIGADWNALFERIQLNTLTYRMPQISPRFHDRLEDYVEQQGSEHDDHVQGTSGGGKGAKDPHAPKPWIIPPRIPENTEGVRSPAGRAGRVRLSKLLVSPPFNQRNHKPDILVIRTSPYHKG